MPKSKQETVEVPGQGKKARPSVRPTVAHQEMVTDGRFQCSAMEEDRAPLKGTALFPPPLPPAFRDRDVWLASAVDDEVWKTMSPNGLPPSGPD